MGKVKKMDKWVPLELNENHKSKSFEISSAILLRSQNYPFHNRIVTCDVKCILYDNRKCSAQRLDADKAPQYFPKPNQKKVLEIDWWSSAGLIHHNFLKTGKTVTVEKYYRKIDEMHQKFTHKTAGISL